MEFWVVVESKRAPLRAREEGKVRIFEKLTEYRYEQLVFCHDKFTGLRAVVAIHDTTLGPASTAAGCGRTRARKRR